MAPPHDAHETLAAGLERLGILDRAAVASRLEIFMAEIERWNPRFGLVKFENRDELVVKHVLDSLSAWTAVRDAAGPSGSVLDVGSGAGFPGIPLAIALPEVTFTLLERMARRASFLKTCAVLVGLPRVHVVQTNLAELRDSFAVVTFRAVAPLDRFLQELETSGVRWSTVIAYKGREKRARQESLDVLRLWGERYQVSVSAVETPFLDEERCLAMVIQGRKGE
jgi:16S rRNA (guanine527-N7)-methyltransferase